MTVLVDSSALIELLIEGSASEWVADQFSLLADEVFTINALIYAEVSVPYANPADLDADLDRLFLDRLPLPYEAAFVAGKAFQAYRARGGTRNSPLPDFYIGAHAQVSGLTLLTRDARRFRTYFPEVDVIAPN